MKTWILIFALFGFTVIKAQDSALVFNQAGYNYLIDTIHPMFTDTLEKEHVDFVPIMITGDLDSLTYINDTLINSATWILSQQSLTDPNFIFIVGYIESQPQRAYFKLKKIKVIYRK